jgi:hypothetical protein
MQAILLAIADWLPPRLRENSNMLRFRIVFLIFQDRNLARDFPLDSSAMEDIVDRVCRTFASTCLLNQLDHLAEFFEDDDSDSEYDDDFRPTPTTEYNVNFWVDAVCTYSHRTAIKARRNLRLGTYIF